MNELCSFCTKPKKDVSWLIKGPDVKIAQTILFAVYICDECVELSVEILVEEKEKKAQARKGPRNKLAELNV